MSEARRKKRVAGTALESGARSSTPSVAAKRAPGDSLLRAIFTGRALWISLALIAATLIVYAPVRGFSFVAFDDAEYIYQNPTVAKGLTWLGIQWAFTTGYFANWHPLTWLSYMWDVELFGSTPGAFHVTNALLHSVDALLLFGLLHWMTGALGRSAFVAALFAVHPLHVESVAWISERKDVLSTLFGLLTVGAYVAYVRRPGRGRYVTVLVLFALGLMCKPMLVTLPFVLLLLDFWPLRRTGLGSQAPSETEPKSIGTLVVEKLPLLALAIASSIATFEVQKLSGALRTLETVPLSFRLQNAVVAYVAYVRKMLWPSRMTAFYPYPASLPGWMLIGSLLGLIVVSILVFWNASRRPYLIVGWLWYLGTLMPVIGLVQVGGQAMADRYTYVPLIGLFIMAAWGLPDLLARWGLSRQALPVAAGFVILACMIASRAQVQTWENNTAFWGHMLQVTSGNYLAHFKLGAVLSGQGKVDEAIAHYNEALRIRPHYAEAHYNLGTTLAGTGKTDEAIAHFLEALRTDPNHVEAHVNLAAALASKGDLNGAVAHFSEVVRLAPQDAFARYNLGGALAMQGKNEEAIRQFQEALRINPAFSEPRRALDDLMRRGKQDSQER